MHYMPYNSIRDVASEQARILSYTAKNQINLERGMHYVPGAAALFVADLNDTLGVGGCTTRAGGAASRSSPPGISCDKFLGRQP
jgi:hypothetical protein